MILIRGNCWGLPFESLDENFLTWHREFLYYFCLWTVITTEGIMVWSPKPCFLKKEMRLLFLQTT